MHSELEVVAADLQVVIAVERLVVELPVPLLAAAPSAVQLERAAAVRREEELPQQSAPPCLGERRAR